MNFVDTFIKDINDNEKFGISSEFRYTVKHSNALLLVKEIERLREENKEFEWGTPITFNSKWGPSKDGIFLKMIEDADNKTAWVVLEGNASLSPVQVKELELRGE